MPLAVAWHDNSPQSHAALRGGSECVSVPCAQEHTDAHKNIALSYALFKFANFMMPYYASFWNDTMHNVGLEVDNSNVDPTSPVGVGNLAGPPGRLQAVQWGATQPHRRSGEGA